MLNARSNRLRPRTRAKLLTGTIISIVLAAIAAQHSGFAQGTPPLEAPPQFLPTDVTPFGVKSQQTFFSPEMRYYLLRMLPSRLSFSSSTEITQRLETNVFQTARQYRQDYVFRAAPNMTLGYNIFPNTSVFCNYFVIKDVFADHKNLSRATTQSLSMGLKQNFMLGKRTTLQAQFQARELWEASHLRQADLLPEIDLTHVVGSNTTMFASTILQMRSRNLFQGATRELDPFFTVGLVHRRGTWQFNATTTYVWNNRNPPFRGSIPKQGNMSMISDFEISHPVSRKIPYTVAFIRAEPIWNWDSNRVAGLSGFDFRLYSGIRIAFAKTAEYGAIEQLRRQLMEAEAPSATPQTTPPRKTAKQQAGRSISQRPAQIPVAEGGSKATQPPPVSAEPIPMVIRQPAASPLDSKDQGEPNQ